jgi:CheY-like chemotaxis protein
MASETITTAGVLIIDPQANMAALVAGMLRSLGRRDIREVNDANQAQTALQRRPFDIIIIDDAIASPGATELVRRLRANAECPNRLTPVIMMSAAPDAAGIAAARIPAQTLCCNASEIAARHHCWQSPTLYRGRALCRTGPAPEDRCGGQG